MKQYIFLDIDGVLNSDNWYNSDENPGNLYGQEADLDPKAIKLINKLTDCTNASIVISSDWKYNWEDTLIRLKQAGLTGRIIGSTPADKEGHRGKEIELWFKYHMPTDDTYINYVVFDDRTDKLELQEKHWITINHTTGITEDDISKALMHLVIT